MLHFWIRGSDLNSIMIQFWTRTDVDNIGNETTCTEDVFNLLWYQLFSHIHERAPIPNLLSWAVFLAASRQILSKRMVVPLNGYIWVVCALLGTEENRFVHNFPHLFLFSLSHLQWCSHNDATDSLECNHFFFSIMWCQKKENKNGRKCQDQYFRYWHKLENSVRTELNDYWLSRTCSFYQWVSN